MGQEAIVATPYREGNVEADPTRYLSPGELEMWERLQNRALWGQLLKEEELALARLTEKIKRLHRGTVAQIERLLEGMHLEGTYLEGK